jgi:hypothetical protein
MGRRSGFQAARPAQPAPESSSEGGVAQLRETVRDLRRQLAETMDRIQQLEKER